MFWAISDCTHNHPILSSIDHISMQLLKIALVADRKSVLILSSPLGTWSFVYKQESMRSRLAKSDQ